MKPKRFTSVESSAGTPLRLPTLREWRSHFVSRGLRDDLIEEYLAYIRPLIKRKVPVIFDAQHLAALLGRTPHFLAKASAAPEYFYRKFNIPKRSGGDRQICSPYPSLKECQRWIADNLLLRLPSSANATAYTPNRSILDHVAPHTGIDNLLLIVDLKDFFPSITKRRVIGFFRELGYNYEVAISLASLCCLDGCLPQGSPASPLISNLIASGLDRRIQGLCRKFELTYTRYADDICLSGKRLHDGVFKLLEQAVERSGFMLNPDKTRVRSAKSTAKILTGINISSGAPRLPRSRRRQLLHTMHFIESYGYISHLQKLKIVDPKYLLRLRGNLEFWRFIEPDNNQVLEFVSRVAELQRLHGDG